MAASTMATGRVRSAVDAEIVVNSPVTTRAAKKKAMIQDYIDVVAEQAVLYPVVHNELMTAWDPRTLTGIRAQPYPGINLLQAKWV